jgi:beta-galactosidase
MSRRRTAIQCTGDDEVGMAASTKSIAVADHTFRVDGRPAELYGGAMHYWRIERERWSGILDSVREMGFTTISIYIPWEVHEVERGVFDFSGNKDIDAFLTLIESKGLRIVVRPGPQINSELTWFGYPVRILADPELQALNSQGTMAVLTQVPRPIPAVSYAADKFFDETALWYDAICEILARHAYPKGGIVAAQVDNEMAFFFHVNAYACDYSPSSIARYQRFLAGKYDTVDAINRTYGTAFDSFGTIDPPRRWEASSREHIPYHTDWIEYRERYLIDSMARLADMMRARGLDQIALFHNYPHPLGPGGAASGFTTPFSIMGLEEKLDFVGFDVYSRKELYAHVKTVLSYVVGTSRFPYIPEFIAGVWPWYLNPGELYDEEFVTKAALMQGIKGFSRYMLVERDRWLDSPIRRDGRVRDDHAAMFSAANTLLCTTDFVNLRREADVLLLANRDYDRLEAASVLVSFPGDFLETPSGFSEYPSYMTVSEQTLGFAEPVQFAKTDRFWAAYHGLAKAGIAYLLSDTALPAGRWADRKALVLAAYEYLNGALQANLVAYAQRGGAVVLGPIVPTLDEAMQPCTVLADAISGVSGTPVTANGVQVGSSYAVGSGRIVVVESLDDAPAALDAALAGITVARFTTTDDRIDVAIHSLPGDSTHAVVFVCNPTPDPIDARISVATPVTSATELWTGEPAKVSGGAISAAMPGYSINVYDCRF